MLPVLDAKGDTVRDRIGACAQACLDHVRAVKWGEGSACYVVTDAGTEMLVSLSVRALGKASGSQPGTESDAAAGKPGNA